MCISTATMARPGGNEGSSSKLPVQGVGSSADGTSREQDGCCPTDDYMMNYYKMVPCKRKYAHDWASCPCKHEGERAARRNLDQHSYMSIACHYAKQRVDCPLGDRCTHTHNMFEYWLHPQRFKTELCQFGSKCNRTICFYAHSMDDLRPLDPSLPPPEACWSSGAMLNKARRHQQRHGQLQAHAQAQAQGPHMSRGGPHPSTRMTGHPGQHSSDGAGMRVPPGMASPPQASPQAPQPQQVLVVNSLPACGTPRTPVSSPAVHPAQYVQQPQQQVVVLQTGQGASSSAAPGGYATITLPVQNAGLPVVSAGGVQGAVVVQAQQPPQPQPQQVVQYSIPSTNQQAMQYSIPSTNQQVVQYSTPSTNQQVVQYNVPSTNQHVVQYSVPSTNQQVIQCNMPGSNQPTYWVQVPDPTAVNSASAPMAGGQVVQIELPATTIAPGSSSLPAQTFVLDGGYVLQQQQQAQAAQGMVSLQALSAPSPAGMVQVGVLDSAIPGLMSTGGPLVMTNELQQQPSSGGSWQCMYPASTHSMLMDLQNMHLC